MNARVPHWTILKTWIFPQLKVNSVWPHISIHCIVFYVDDAFNTTIWLFRHTHIYNIYVDVTDTFSFKKIPVLTTVLMCSMYIEMIWKYIFGGTCLMDTLPHMFASHSFGE